jgi:hypothetical protein
MSITWSLVAKERIFLISVIIYVPFYLFLMVFTWSLVAKRTLTEEKALRDCVFVGSGMPVYKFNQFKNTFNTKNGFLKLHILK